MTNRRVLGRRVFGLAGIGLWALFMLAAPSASAVVLSDFVIFADGNVSLSTWAMAISGLIGSNHNVTLGAGAMVHGLMGGGNLLVGTNGSVAGDIVFNGNVRLGSKTDVFGDVDSGGSILLKNQAVIHGDATAGGAINVQAGAHILGTSSPGGSPAVFTPLVLPPATVFSAGGPDIVKGKHQTTTLSPGIYGDLILGNKNTLNLSSGTYFFDSVQAAGHLKLNIDLSSGGLIHVFVVDDVRFGGGLKVTPIGGGAERIYFETHGDWFTGKGSKWFGTVYAPNGDMAFSSNEHLEGAFYSGGKISIRGESSYDHEPLLPEPMSLSLFGLGLMGLGLGHRRRTSLTH